MVQILSIQSSVSYGFAGNSVVVFALRRLGVDVWPVFTVNFSNHTGYGAWRGDVMTPGQVAEIVQGIDERGHLADIDVVMSGYQGAPPMGRAILDALELTRERNAAAQYFCDPVMGDVDRGFYAVEGIPEFMRAEVVPRADVVTPNLFELEYLTGTKPGSLTEVVSAVETLRSMGPTTVLVTSVVGERFGADCMRMITQDDHGTWVVETPMIDRKFTGSGDLTSACFLAAMQAHPGDLGAALSDTAAAVHAVLETTAELDFPELALVQGQNLMADPVDRFDVHPL